MIRLKPEQDGLLQSYDVLADAFVYIDNVYSHITACPHIFSLPQYLTSASVHSKMNLFLPLGP